MKRPTKMMRLMSNCRPLLGERRLGRLSKMEQSTHRGGAADDRPSSLRSGGRSLLHATSLGRHTDR
jgi:hypothetical protein